MNCNVVNLIVRYKSAYRLDELVDDYWAYLDKAHSLFLYRNKTMMSLQEQNISYSSIQYFLIHPTLTNVPPEKL